MALYGSTNISATTPNLQVIAATHKTQFQLTAATATLRRAFVYEWKVGPNSVPNAATDCEIAWTVIIQTTAVTGTAMTANKQDGADAVSGSVVTANFTAEPSGAETGIIDGIGTNQRGSFRWVVAPGGPGELVVPASNANGIGIRAKSSNYIGNSLCGMLWRE